MRFLRPFLALMVLGATALVGQVRVTGGTPASPTVGSLSINAPFTFDTTNTKSIQAFTNLVGTTGTADPCFLEERNTVVNLGITNANCHVVYIPTLTGTFGSNNALQVAGTFSAVRNASNQGAGKLNATGGLETCRSITANAQCWGTTLYAADTGGAVGILAGVFIGLSLQNTVASYTGAAANPQGATITIQNAGHNGDLGTGIQIQQTSPARWSIGYKTLDSAAAIGLQLGALGPQASQASQPINLCDRDSGAAVHCLDVLHLDAFNQTSINTGGLNTLILGSPGQLILSQGAVQDKAQALTCGAATTPALDPRTGNYFTCNITGNVAVVVAVPSPAVPAGQSEAIYITYRNSSGGALTTAPTFNTGAGGFKFSAVTNPANGLQVTYCFRWDPVQSFWYEVGTHLAAGL